MNSLTVLSSGQMSSGYVVSSTDQLRLLSGASAFHGTVLNFGDEEIFSGGFTSGLVVYASGFVGDSDGNGDSIHLHSGASAQLEGTCTISGLVVEHGGSAFIDVSTLEHTIVAGIEDIQGGVTSGALVTSGGEMDFYNSGSSINDVTVQSGGTILFYTDPEFRNVHDLKVESGATEIIYQTVSPGERVSGFAAVPGGEQRVSSGGVAIDTTLPVGTDEIIYSGGKVDGLTANGVSGGGVIISIASGGVAKKLTVLGTSYLFVEAGAIASGAVIFSGGDEVIDGLAKAVTLSNGASGIVVSGGLASGVTIESGGVVSVMALSEAKALVISSGGELIVSSGGSVSGMHIESGGKLVLKDGGTASGLTRDPGGVVTHPKRSAAAVVTTPANLVQALAGFEPSAGALDSPQSDHAIIGAEHVLAPSGRG